MPAPVRMSVDGAAWHGLPQHLLQAERLRAQLQVGVRAMPPADLMLHWVRTVSAQLDNIGFASETVPLRPERDAAQHPDAALDRRFGRVRPFVGNPPTNGEHVLLVGLLDVDEGTLA